MLPPIAVLLAAGPLITITPSQDETLVATFALQESTQAYHFAPNDTPQRADAWAPMGEGWTFDGETVVRADGKAFDTFRLRIAPDPRAHDRRYVVSSPIGDGWSIYLAAFGGKDEPVQIRFEGFGDDAVLRLPRHGGGVHAVVTTDSDDRRVAYVGPSGLVRPGDMTLVAGPELPEWVADALVEDAGRVARVLEDRLGAPALHPPTILASYPPRGDALSLKGGTFEGATLRLVMKSNLDERDEDRATQLAAFAAHETVHIWLNEVWDTAENAEQPWLHEGVAEYLADRLSLDRVTFQAEAARHVTDCLANLGNRPLDGSDGAVYGAVPYDCGFTLQLAAEIASLRRDGDDALDLWRAVVESAQAHQYDSAMFLKEATERGGRDFTSVADALLAASGDGKAEAVADALEAVDLTVSWAEAGSEDGPAVGREAMAALQRAHCGGNISFYSESDGYRFALPDLCEPGFLHDAYVVGVQGISFAADGVAAYNAMKNVCDERGELVLIVKDETRLEPFRCEALLPPARGAALLARLPELPDLDR
ncbi:hypothetical protein [Parvularcula oceani]|uniref:hypothetical protein n=1 Tax=Parvularcula oceani TaxID=1247963 RepID=UPI0004E15972|nr:hypothetical protein [Parvularcula oceani]